MFLCVFVVGFVLFFVVAGVSVLFLLLSSSFVCSCCGFYFLFFYFFFEGGFVVGFCMGFLGRFGVGGSAEGSYSTKIV